MKEIVVNWHIIQKCNYKCDYCFAHYEKEHIKEVYHSKKDIEKLLIKVYDFFIFTYKKPIRLNIAGGEPTLSKNISFIIRKAREIGFNVSIITNGSLVTNKFINENAKYLSMYAISIDSLKIEQNLKIGRVNKNITLRKSEILKQIESLKNINPNINIKINTVVNKHNFKEELYHFINVIKPNKWKVLQALPINTKNIFCTDKQFNSFLELNNNSRILISKESKNDMTESYIMIDPYGRFYQNSNSHYLYSKSILENNIENEFRSLDFNLEKFLRRY